MGSCAVAAAIHKSDAGSKSLDFVPVPSRETVVGSCVVAADIHGSDAGSKSLISYRCPVANPHGFLRCSRSPSRIQGSVPVLALQLNEFSRSLLVGARTHPPISTHTMVRVSFCLLGKWYGKVVFYSRWDEVANSA